MTIQERLDQLPVKITRALQPSFIFVIKESIIQHFPIREWSAQKILLELNQRLGPNFESKTWKNQLVCWNQSQNLLLIIPKYTSLQQLKSEIDSH